MTAVFFLPLIFDVIFLICQLKQKVTPKNKIYERHH